MRNPTILASGGNHFFYDDRTRARDEFHRWLSIRHPKIAQQVLRRIERQFGYQHGLSAVDAGGNPIPEQTAAPGWLTSVMDAVKAVAQTKAQVDIIKLNAQRAEKGLPPIDTSQIAPTVNVGASPGVQRLGFLAIGALVVLGLLRAFRR